MPDMISVDSTNIEAVGYDEASLELHVQFTAGTIYIYYEVPRQVFDDLLAAPSKGSFLNREVKPVYRYAKQ